MQAILDWTPRRPLLWGVVCALGAVLAANLIALFLTEALGEIPVSMVFLAGVLVVAVLAGAVAGYLAAVLGFLSYNLYLVEPRFSFGVESEDVFILIVFLGVAMLTGGLAGRLRDANLRAKSQARTTDLLFKAGRDLAALGEERLIIERLAAGLSDAGRGAAVVRSDKIVIISPADAFPPALDAAPAPPGVVELRDGWCVRGLWADGRPLGLAAWTAPAGPAPHADQSRLIEVLLDMGAAAISRARLSRAWAEVEARTRTESLRNALLSSISHDLRTPLASILASATSLKAFGHSFDAEVRDDLLDTIEEEAERLNRFVGNLLNMTRLEAGALTLTTAPFDVRESLERAAQAHRRRAGASRIEVRVEDQGLVALGDVILFEQALGNVIENALRFSPDRGRIEVSARRQGELLLIEVADEGPGVPQEALERVFEKFYRAANDEERQAGAGLGLSIVRGLVEAMGGDVSARRRSADGGLVIGLRLSGEAV